jgi:uncharacterized protein (DUF2252 family)
MAAKNNDMEPPDAVSIAGMAMPRELALGAGRSLRDQLPRTNHAGWNAPAGRFDPVEVLIDSGKNRDPALLPIRYGRMLQSPFSFYRGAAAIMAADLAGTPSTGIMVQACGDCHLLNFGSYATPERRLVFDINDFDETLPAPWEWDVKRLATSFLIASIDKKMGLLMAKNITRQCLNSYRQHIIEYAAMDPLSVWYSSISLEDAMRNSKNEEAKKMVGRQIEKARTRSLTGEDFPKLTEMKDGIVKIKDNPPLIYHRTGIDAKKYKALVEEVFANYVETLGDDKKTLLGHYSFHDIAVKVVGIGSVGTLCSVALWMSANNEPLFLQIKEARNSVLEPYAGKSIYQNHGQRVVTGQKLMQAASDVFLGWTSISAGRQFYVRQLRDMKIKPLVEVYDDKMMEGYARLCGRALARAHARSGNAGLIGGYLGTSSKFDDAIVEFAYNYAAQNEKDHNALKNAVRDGVVEAYMER